MMSPVNSERSGSLEFQGGKCEQHHERPAGVEYERDHAMGCTTGEGIAL